MTDWLKAKLGRVRVSTAVLMAAFIVLFWVHQTFEPHPATRAPAPAVVPPGFVPDPNYTWVPRTQVRRPREPVYTTTTPPTTTTTTTSPTETTSPTSPTETTSPTSPTETPTTTVVDPDGSGPLPPQTQTVTPTPVPPTTVPLGPLPSPTTVAPPS